VWFFREKLIKYNAYQIEITYENLFTAKILNKIFSFLGAGKIEEYINDNDKKLNYEDKYKDDFQYR
jgi:hypothetical protein